jgi:hypothetical protein
MPVLSHVMLGFLHKFSVPKLKRDPEPTCTRGAHSKACADHRWIVSPPGLAGVDYPSIGVLGYLGAARDDSGVFFHLRLRTMWGPPNVMLA